MWGSGSISVGLVKRGLWSGPTLAYLAGGHLKCGHARPRLLPAIRAWSSARLLDAPARASSVQHTPSRECSCQGACWRRVPRLWSPTERYIALQYCARFYNGSSNVARMRNCSRWLKLTPRGGSPGAPAAWTSCPLSVLVATACDEASRFEVSARQSVKPVVCSPG